MTCMSDPLLSALTNVENRFLAPVSVINIYRNVAPTAAINEDSLDHPLSFLLAVIERLDEIVNHFCSEPV